jgi:hypothetical protein
MKALRIISGILGIVVCILTLVTSVKHLLLDFNINTDPFSSFAPVITEIIVIVACMLIASIICLNQKVGYFGMLIALMLIYYVGHKESLATYNAYICNIMFALLVTGAFVKGFSANKK